MPNDILAPSGQIDPDSPTPLYHQLYLLLRHQILSAALTSGQRLPSEHDLAARFNVSRITAKRSLNELAQEGLVTRTRGRGTTVAYQAPHMAAQRGMSGLLDNLAAIVDVTDVEVLSFGFVPASPDVAARLGVQPGETVQRAERRRCKANEPFSLMTTYVPDDIGRTFDAEDLSRKPILYLIEQAGVSIHEAMQTISASAALPHVARALQVPVGAPLLRVERSVQDTRGRVVQVIEVLYRPDMYQLDMTLRRGGEAARTAWFEVDEA